MYVLQVMPHEIPEDGSLLYGFLRREIRDFAVATRSNWWPSPRTNAGAASSHLATILWSPSELQIVAAVI
jgi:hypothetical protein